MKGSAAAVQVELVDLPERGALPTDGADLQRGRGAGFEASEDHSAVLGLCVARRIRARIAWNEAVAVGADLGDLAEEPPGHVEPMRTEVTEYSRAGPCFVEAPGVRAVACVAGEVPHAQVVRLADVAVGDQLLDELVGGHEAVGEGNHRDQPVPRGGVGHLSGLGDVHPERLLAEDRKAPIEGRHRDLVMCLVG